MLKFLAKVAEKFNYDKEVFYNNLQNLLIQLVQCGSYYINQKCQLV